MATRNLQRRIVGVSACIAIVASMSVADPAQAEARVLEIIRVGQGIQGPFQRVVYDRSGVVWVATPDKLYRLEGAKPVLVDEASAGEKKLALAPGGDRYAWLSRRMAPFAQFSVELVDLNNPGSPVGILRTGKDLATASTIHIGHRGRLLVTETPLDDLEGIKGRFKYTFWSSEGRQLGSIELDGPRIGIVDERGEAVLLLGENDAVAIGKHGSLLWKVDGYYRKGALAGDGEIALLNPGRNVDEVLVVRGGKVTLVEMPDSVHVLALTPDGSTAGIATGKGRMSFLFPGSCEARECPLTHLQPISPIGSNFITAIRFIDRETVVLGALYGSGAGPYTTFHTAIVLAVTTSGRLIFSKALRLTQPATYGPFVDCTFDAGVFTAYTGMEALIGQVED